MTDRNPYLPEKGDLENRVPVSFKIILNLENQPVQLVPIAFEYFFGGPPAR